MRRKEMTMTEICEVDNAGVLSPAPRLRGPLGRESQGAHTEEVS